MRNQPTDSPKRPVNLSINAHTLDQAKKLGMNLSKTVDAFLQEEVKRRYWEQWREENQQAFAAYNERVAKDGLWATQHRSFGKSVGDGREE
jgi:antitoxin CcdA